jgi:hypothetical protein
VVERQGLVPVNRDVAEDDVLLGAVGLDGVRWRAPTALHLAQEAQRLPDP